MKKICGFVMTPVPEFPSQLGQDKWVLEKKPNGGFFLELGCYHPKELSNTFALEQRGWRGVSIDPFPSGDWTTRPNTRLIRGAVTSHGRPIRFIKGAELGGDEAHIGMHKYKISKCERVVIPSISARELILEYDIPKKIDYLSIVNCTSFSHKLSCKRKSKNGIPVQL